MAEIFNGKYRKLKKNPIGKGGQAKVFLYEQIDDKKKFFYFLPQN
jgi:hypothetical protein